MIRMVDLTRFATAIAFGGRRYFLDPGYFGGQC